MTTKVPLKIRVDIRDVWDSPTSEVKTAASNLAKTLGHNVTPIVQWPTLYNELKDQYPDNTTFVPSISRIVVTWYERLQFRLDNAISPEWTEKLLELMSSVNKHELVIEPSQPPHDRPATKWDTKYSTFHLGIPKTEAPSFSTITSGFDQDFEDLFKQGGEGTATTTEEGWDDLTAEPPAVATTSPSKPAITTHSVSTLPSETKPRVGRIPNIAELPRPDVLFAQRSPHILTLDTGNPTTIRCSHEASLQLMKTYFTRWGRVNNNDSEKRNFFKIELLGSTVLNGVSDTVTIEPSSNFRTASWTVNPALILAFIEGTLGYTLVHTDGRNWVYRSDAILK